MRPGAFGTPAVTAPWGLFSALAFLLIFLGSPVRAQECPDFYRFVDFGLVGSEGAIYRGGPTFRAESFEGTPLLLMDQTDCLDIADLARDGRGNPIPVVVSISFDPSKTGLDLSQLRVSAVPDARFAAEENAQEHRTRLRRAETVIARGPDFLCVREGIRSEVSCQLQSPYPLDGPLVIYCDAVMCRMPVLQITARLMASATWPSFGSGLNDPRNAGRDMGDRVRKIFAFLAPLSADL